MVMRGVIWASLLLVSLPDRGEGGGWYSHRPKLTLDYLHGPLADSLSRYRGTPTWGGRRSKYSMRARNMYRWSNERRNQAGQRDEKSKVRRREEDKRESKEINESIGNMPGEQ
jgi:hypothetical protein